MSGIVPRRRALPSWVVVVIMALALLTVSASTSFLMRPTQDPQQFAMDKIPVVAPATPPDQPRGLHVYLVPHPDDELSAWTSLLDGGDLYPVLVLLTQGEATQRCAAESIAKHLNPELGESAPHPDPRQEGAASAACREARLDSFQRAVSAAADTTPLVTLDWSDAQDVKIEGQSVKVVSGPAATLLVLDMGDGTLTADAVATMVQRLLTHPDSVVPGLPVVRITSSAYYASEATAGNSDCQDLAMCPAGDAAYLYDHPDHLAVREAARSLATLSDETWLVTHPFDPAANKHLALSSGIYDQFMELGSGAPWEAQRFGSHQRIYGWLAFPDAWRTGDLPLASSQVLFPRVQSFDVVSP